MAVGLFALVGDLPDDGYFIVSGVGNQGIVEPSPLPLDEPGSVAADDEWDLLERLCSRLLHCALSTSETDTRSILAQVAGSQVRCQNVRGLAISSCDKLRGWGSDCVHSGQSP